MRETEMELSALHFHSQGGAFCPLAGVGLSAIACQHQHLCADSAVSVSGERWLSGENAKWRYSVTVNVVSNLQTSNLI